jgi:2'-5' RNA ligase
MKREPARTALVVVADAAEEVLAPWRRRFNASAVERCIPSHVTILFPLVPAAEVDDDLLSQLRGLYRPLGPFAYDLARLETFPGVAWLVPDPAAPFDVLIERTRAAFPHCPPYGDPALDPVPHCTVGVTEDPRALEAMVAELRSGLEPAMPIRCAATAVALLAEHADGTWSTRAAFPFEAPG